MSTSPSASQAACVQHSTTLPRQAMVSPFPYQQISSRRDDPPLGSDEAQSPGGLAADEGSAREQKARMAGRLEAESEMRRGFEDKLTQQRQQITQTLSEFARDRAAYYHRVESEVVQLALSIARKILHREAQVDPLLLAGIVRVALDRMDGATRVVVRVAPGSAAQWRQYLTSHMEPGRVPEIVEEASLEPERCVLQTSMGSAELGIEVQLKEIERGLTDLLAARPEATP